MKKFSILCTAVLLAAGLLFAARAPLSHFYKVAKSGKHSRHLVKKASLNDGDMIFQSSVSSQCKAVQLATHSKWSHCGILFKKGEEFYVYEAVQPVCVTRLADWIARGEGRHYAIKRLKNAGQVLTAPVLAKMKQVGEQYMGKDYDLCFEWSDDRIYCSELIWKIYQRGAGIETGKLQQLKDFDLDHPLVKQKLKERYGDKIPLNEKVISPGAIFDDPQLITVEQY